MLKRSFFSLTLFITLLTIQTTYAQLKIMTWNLQNVGQSKTDEHIQFIADIMKNADIIAIQEIVTNPSGAKTVAKIHTELNTSSGVKWEYSLSDPTDSSPYRSERYAYFWKTSRVKLKTKASLDTFHKDDIEREPYMATFTYKGKELTIFSFHALPKKHQPETEIKYFKFYPDLYPDKNLIFTGDFNTPQTHTVFNPLKKLGYKPVFENQKTSLRQKCINDDCLASEYDNFFLSDSSFEIIDFKPIYFFQSFEDIKDARKISDHIPLLIEIIIK